MFKTYMHVSRSHQVSIFKPSFKLMQQTLIISIIRFLVTVSQASYIKLERKEVLSDYKF